ncbi:MAG: hypothetical protein OXC92_11045 [Flavobacteriaceae bacterium]|nr:hypothetical protein [Flavobacteriaceae bacterium]MCY4253784.1 hypothetical protein [Flavobacteriaceae bacterium]
MTKRVITMWDTKKINQALVKYADWGAKKTLANGVPIYYLDEDYPGKKIKEYPNGRRFIVFTEGRTETIIEQIPPRKEK